MNNVLDEKLKELQFFEANCMEPNWDGEGSYPLSHKIILLSKAIIEKLDNVDYEMSIHTHGTLSFEQENNFFRASFEIGNKNYSVYLKNKNDEIQNEYKTGDNKDMNTLLNDIEHFLINPFKLNNHSTLKLKN